MNTDIEHLAPVEARMAGGDLHGTIISYGEIARDRPEMFLPGAFVSGLDTGALNLQHDREHVIAEQSNGLTFTDTVRSLDLRAQLRPDSAEARLIRRKALQGLSVEFVALEDRRDNGLRVVSKAHFAGVALVDSGSYRSNLELRARMTDAWFLAEIPLGGSMECRCQGPDCTDVEFEAGAFDEMLADDGEVLAVGGGGFSNVLGSRKRGTLLLDKADDSLKVGLTSEHTETARQIVENARVAPIYARPILDLEASEYIDEGTTRKSSRANVRAILVKPTDADRGHTPAKIRGVEPEKRRRMWL